MSSAQRILLGLDSSMSNTGALKDAAYGVEAAQRSTEGKGTRKLLTMLKRSVACSQRTKDFRIKTECQPRPHCFLEQVT